MVQVFRRQDSPYESIRLRLRGLDANATYVLTNLDVPGTTSTSGRELLEQGLAIALAARPGAAIITYRKQP